jgi:hypothetical protein
MNPFFPALVTVLVLGGAVHARLIEREITPAEAGRSGWEITVRPDGDLVRFTVVRGDKAGSLKEGTTAQLVVRDGKRLISTSSLGLTAEGGKFCFTFCVAASHLKGSRFELELLDVPHPSGDIWWISLQKFHDAQVKTDPTKQDPADKKR